MASAVTDLIRSQKRRIRGEQAKKKRRHFTFPSFFSISIASLQGSFNLKKSTASDLRAKIEPHFGIIKEDLEPFIISDTQLSSSQLNLARKYTNPQLSKKLICRNGKVYIQQPHLIRTFLVGKKRIFDKTRNINKRDI